jgi:LAGLIDADG DNA endonuclease family
MKIKKTYKKQLFMFEKRNLRGKALADYKKTLVLNDLQTDIIIGSLLGDSTMGLRKGVPLYSLKFEQSVKKQGYIFHLADIFDKFCGSPPARRWIDKKKTRESLWFRTYRHNSFAFFFNLFYVIEEDPVTGQPFSRKIVPLNISKFLNPRVVAYWFMDDGTFHKDRRSGAKQYYFSTQGFQKSECELLCDALRTCLNIQTNVHKDRKYWRIYIRAQSNHLFLDLISPYIVDDLLYKL